MSKEPSKQKVRRRKVSFSLEAPEANEVILMADFNQWEPGRHIMNRNEQGVWEKTAMLPPGRYEYRFLVDGRWQNDPNNPDFCDNCFGTRNNLLLIP